MLTTKMSESASDWVRELKVVYPDGGGADAIS